MKESKRVYRGIEFICIDELPADQQLLLQHAETPERIKILIDTTVLSNCIEYTHYSEWFSSVYKQSVATPEFQRAKEEVYHPSIEAALTKVQA